MTAPEVIEGEAAEVGAEIAPVTPGTLWRTDDPAEILKRAKETADALAPVIREAGLVSNISGKDYLQVEAWQTLGQQVGVTPVVVSTRRVSDPDGWEARCEARTLDGRTIGAADSMCLRSEERWKNSEDFELRSMAQTRAMSRALASVLRFIPTLAGMAGTPAEEMQGRGGGNGGSSDRGASEKQKKFAYALLKAAKLEGRAREVVHAWSHNADGELIGNKASRIIELLKTERRGQAPDPGKVGELLDEAGYSNVPPADTSDFEDAPRPERPEDQDPFEYRPEDE